MSVQIGNVNISSGADFERFRLQRCVGFSAGTNQVFQQGTALNTPHSF
jgi:hypothetical protein